MATTLHPPKPLAHRNGSRVIRRKIAPQSKAKVKWVYLFAEGDGKMRDLLGGKGANLAEMTRLGIPVPPGFIVTTKACNAYLAAGDFPKGTWEQELAALKELEKLSGK